ncbi:hypothetical protein L1049_015736 [Liquidambar formosana]|uniref:MLO-like protein n=1 Tax=Liquidambar formosana TaxID=63359 RepID=A0AAP0X2Q6_LIQFO
MRVGVLYGFKTYIFIFTLSVCVCAVSKIPQQVASKLCAAPNMELEMMEEQILANFSLGINMTIYMCLRIASVVFDLILWRGLNRLGKYLERKNQKALEEALRKLKDELMLLGFISLLLAVFQGVISRICIAKHLVSFMLPCKDTISLDNHEQFSRQGTKNGRRLLSTDAGSDHCIHKGKVPLLSIEALHQLHIFIFVLAVVHVIFCVTTMVLGRLKIQQWKYWEDAVNPKTSEESNISKKDRARHYQAFLKQRTLGRWRKSTVGSWMKAFFKQFYFSVTKSDYIALRHGFIMEHCRSEVTFDFHDYMMRTLENDFKKVVGISSWYLWVFVVLFLLLNVEGWHTYFWLSFLPLILLLLVGAKLAHIIACLAQEVRGRETNDQDTIKPSDDHFWFGSPIIMLYLIQFIWFQNLFEIGFFFWIWSTYGFNSCIMEKVGYIIPRLIMGVIVQVLCSYSTLPLYAIITQMGSLFKETMFEDHMAAKLKAWRQRTRMDKVAKESFETADETTVVVEGTTTSIVELSCPPQIHTPSSSSSSERKVYF